MIDLIWKDKSRQTFETEQFELVSRTMFIYPDYSQENESKNFDICLIKTSIDNFGMSFDLTSKFDSIPCLPENIELQKVFWYVWVI